MAIKVGEEQKKKQGKGKEVPQSLDIFLPVTLILLLLMGGAYFFVLSLESQAKEEKEELERMIEVKEEEIPEETEERVERYSDLFNDFKTVVERHHVASPFFEPLERRMHSRVEINILDLDLENNELSLSGEGEGFVAVGQQFHALKDADFIKEIDLSNLELVKAEEGPDHINFSFEGRVKPELIKFITEEDD